MNLTQVPSPNYTVGRHGTKPTKVILHWIDGTLADADAVFDNPATEHSAHYAVGRGGEVHQYVQEKDTSWGAGWYPVNLECFNVEHEGSPNEPITDEVYATSAELLAGICARWGIIPNDQTFLPHDSIVPTSCPGTLDIHRLWVAVADILDQKFEVTQATEGKPIHRSTVTADLLFIRTSPEVTPGNHALLNGHPDAILKGGPLDWDSVVIGEDINGITTWFHKPDDRYCWTGGTDYNPTLTT